MGCFPDGSGHKVPVSTVEGLERKMNTYLRRWLGVPRSFCSIGLYSTGSKLQLPVHPWSRSTRQQKHTRL